MSPYKALSHEMGQYSEMSHGQFNTSHHHLKPYLSHEMGQFSEMGC